jgi:hypothetical protein
MFSFYLVFISKDDESLVIIAHHYTAMAIEGTLY